MFRRENFTARGELQFAVVLKDQHGALSIHIHTL